MNIIEYINNKNVQLDINNELDILTLSLSVYFNFESYFNTTTIFPVKFSDIINKHTPNTSVGRLNKKHEKLVMGMAHNPKFSDLQIINFVNNTNVEEEKQFAAITYRISQTEIFIAFRGTDSTVLGWKEDFNMSFSKNVPSQNEGLHYLNTTKLDSIEKIHVGGHSKGGNIAVFASAFCNQHVKDKIVKVYNFDGPGFHSEIIKSDNYKKLLPAAIKYIPNSSIIGRLMETSEQEIIIKSNQVSIFQHDPYSWIILKGALLRHHGLTYSSNKLATALQKWLEDISNEERKYVVDEVYRSFRKLEIDSFIDAKIFIEPRTVRKAISSFNSIDPAFKSYTKRLSRQLITILMSRD